MKVILLDDVVRVGHEGEVLEVANGYFRNYLEPRNLAVRATKGALKELEARGRAIEGRDEEKREKAQELVESLREHKLVIRAPTGARADQFRTGPPRPGHTGGDPRDGRLPGQRQGLQGRHRTASYQRDPNRHRGREEAGRRGCGARDSSGAGSRGGGRGRQRRARVGQTAGYRLPTTDY